MGLRNQSGSPVLSLVLVSHVFLLNRTGQIDQIDHSTGTPPSCGAAWLEKDGLNLTAWTVLQRLCKMEMFGPQEMNELLIFQELIKGER